MNNTHKNILLQKGNNVPNLLKKICKISFLQTKKN